MSHLVGTVLFALTIAVLATTVYAFVHAAMQRPDAYTAVDKLTKQNWLAILGGAALLVLLLPAIGLGVIGTVAAAVAAGVYLVDVRPKILEIQGKSR